MSAATINSGATSAPCNCAMEMVKTGGAGAAGGAALGAGTVAGLQGAATSGSAVAPIAAQVLTIIDTTLTGGGFTLLLTLIGLGVGVLAAAKSEPCNCQNAAK